MLSNGLTTILFVTDEMDFLWKCCNICVVDYKLDDIPALYDMKTLSGPWANVCSEHFDSNTQKELGVGKGQMFVYVGSTIPLTNPRGFIYWNAITPSGNTTVFTNPDGETLCFTCLDAYKAMFDGEGWDGPNHMPSPYCRSGKHPHCTCGTCF